MITIKATIFLDGSFWVAVFERTDKEGYAVARKIFGTEPSDAEIYDFVLNNYQELKFGAPQEFHLVIKRMNPKRLQREARRTMEKIKATTKPSTHAQDYLREEIEKKKKQRKNLSQKEKQARKERQFLQKQEKRKRKHRGH
jgi:hypothetical protein